MARLNRRGVPGMRSLRTIGTGPGGARATRRGPRIVVVLATLAAFALATGCASFGRSATGERLQRMEASPEWHDDRFRDPQATWDDVWDSLRKLFESRPGEEPDGPVPVVGSDGTLFATPSSTGLRITWFGHSSTLIEIDGIDVLVDPIWSPRTSPFPWAGPRRWYDPPLALARLPHIDAVLISHDHYDHLDRETIMAMKAWTTVFVVPLGIGAHLEAWGIARSRIIELDWWQSTRIGDVEVAATPARHASGRLYPDRDATLWSGFALTGPRHRLYYSGDTGFFPGLQDIGARFGPFDVTLLDVGQYDPDWPDWHMGPEQAVEANRVVRGKVMIPVHWGLFRLAYHGWTEPVERVIAASRCTPTVVMTPRPGQSVEPARRPLEAIAPWWPPTPWRTADQQPILSTRNGAPSDRFAPVACGEAAGD